MAASCRALRRAKSTESTRRVVVERWFIGSLSRGVMVLMGLTVGLAGSWLLLGLNKLAYRYSPAWSVSSLQPTAELRPATHSGDSPGRLDLPGGASPSPWTGAVDPCPGPGTFCPGTQSRGGQSWCRDRREQAEVIQHWPGPGLDPIEYVLTSGSLFLDGGNAGALTPTCSGGAWNVQYTNNRSGTTAELWLEPHPKDDRDPW